MLLKKTTINKETAQQFFPELVRDGEKYNYIVEVSALKLQGRKTFQSLHITAARERNEGDYIMRELFTQVPCLRASLIKPTREAMRDFIYFEAKRLLLDKANNLLPLNHPYVTTLESM
jgi:hypothetical protein